MKFTDVLEEYTASIFRTEAGHSMFLQNMGYLAPDGTA
jgi:hypothetical protein